MKRSLIAAALLLLSLSGPPALAQSGSTGSITGTISDPTSAVVPGATITIKNNATNQEFTATSTDNGTFSVPALISGTYTVTIAAPGFKTTILPNVKVDVGTPSSVNVTLEVGVPTETVQIVDAAGELIQTQNATVGTTITGRQIIDQPQASRDALDLVTLLPGVQTTGRPRTSTVNGLPKGALNITLDGVDVQDNLISSNDGFFTFVRPRIDAVGEVTVSTAAPGAESAGDGAVQIKFVTRGGTNDFGGSVYWYRREPYLTANYFFNNQTLAPTYFGKAPKNRILLNQYGVRAGGPITIPKLFNGKDRAFFFVNYEEFRLPEQQLRQRTVLSPLAQQGIFTTSSGAQVNVLNLAGANGFTSTVDPTVSALLGEIRATTAQGNVLPIAGDPNRQQFNFVGQGGQDRYFTTVRFDFNLTSNHALSNVWNYQEFGGKPVDFLNQTDPSFPGFPNSAGQNSQRWTNVTSLRSTLTPNLVNEARFGMLGGQSNFGPIGPDQFGNQGGFDLNLFDLGITDASAVQAFPQRFNRAFGVNFGSSKRNTPSFDFSDSMTWVKGKHSLNFGGNYNLIKTFSDAANNVVGNVNFGIAEGDPAEDLFTAANFPGASANDLATAAQLYATLTGRVTAVDRTAFLNDGKYGLFGSQILKFRQRQFALFAQDSWRFRQNVTVNFGVRWEPQQPILSKNENFAKATFAGLFGESGEGNLFKPGTLTGSTTQLTPLAIDEELYKADWNNFAPSASVAWSPNFQSGLLHRLFGDAGKSVVRGGYSVAFVREGLGNITQILQGNPGGTLALSSDVDAGNLPVGTLFRNRAALAPPAFADTPSYPISVQPLDTIGGFDPNLKTGLVHSWNFGVQREIFKDTVVEARYVGTRGRNLWRRYGLNEVNILENGFLSEFRQAQSNLAANIAAGRGNTYAFFGAGTGTQPLPIMLGFFTGDRSNANSAAAYAGVAQFTNTTRLTQLNPNFANPVGFATTLQNTFLANGVAAGSPANFFVVNPTVGLLGAGIQSVTLTTNDVDTWYDALQIEFRRRMSAGLLLQMSYTWSKSLSNFYASSQSSAGQPLTLRSDLNKPLERYRAPQDIQHGFKANWIYEMPFGRGRWVMGDANGLTNHLVGGWEWHGTARVQSGRPFALGNVQLVGMDVKELQQAVDARKQPNRTVTFLPDDIILNTRRAFSVSATGAGFGALGAPTGRYIAPANSNGCVQAFVGQCGFANLILEGPRFVRFDMSLVKKIRFNETKNIEFRVELLNAFNNINFLVGGSSAVDDPKLTATNLGLQTPNYGGANFGLITTAYQDISTTNDPGGRPVQFVFRFNF
ncbi:MAG TPA: TonB-dependent receptor [Pyrinomonadaceae bacterium]|nr:TonB-dependent receptor [Pyrinomonadaceae bacterium]